MIKALTVSLALAGVSLSAAAQDAKAGEKLAATCIGCHGIVGYQARFPEVHRVPMISGQTAGYITAALQAYAKGERRHPTMKGISISLSEQDMADLGAFYAQHGGAQAAPETVPAPSPAVAKLLEQGACVSCHGANFSKPISDAYAKTLSAEMLMSDDAEFKARREMHTKVMRALPDKKAAQYLQLEARLRAAKMYDIAAAMPVIK
jgi:cytochrome c553